METVGCGAIVSARTPPAINGKTMVILKNK
jgi:hypothetical protein